MNLLIQNDNLNWIIDEIANDYKAHTRHTVVTSRPDVAWCMSFRDVHSIEKYSCPKVVTVHHLEPHKIKGFAHLFNSINAHNITCLVPNEITRAELAKHVQVPIFIVPYWLLSSRMAPSRGDIVTTLREKYVEKDEIVIGSFQKDSVGNTMDPKLSKGPDVFLDIVSRLHKTHNIKVLLAGFSRKYIVYNLRKRGIKHHYFHRHENINDLYDLLDWYFVTSRVEGGPQAVLEAPYRGVRLLSTKVGLAPEVLDSSSLCGSVNDFIAKFDSGSDFVTANRQNVVDGYLPSKAISVIDSFLEIL